MTPTTAHAASAYDAATAAIEVEAMADFFTTFGADDGLLSSKGLLSSFLADVGGVAHPEAPYRPGAGTALVGGTTFLLS